MKPELLIIFYRNPELGKVKTRLAATVGDERALAIYYKLASHTRSVATAVACDRIVYYSDYVDTEDAWPNERFLKALQSPGDLGEKMTQAFKKSFAQGYQRVCIIGTDCYELEPTILNSAFEALKTNDVVMGPARDGGYYLLGMTWFLPQLFTNKKWSTDSVGSDTVMEIKALGLSYAQLTVLNDVDREEDLPWELR